MKFLLPLAFMFMFTNAYADKIDMQDINKTASEDFKVNKFRIHDRTNINNGDQIQTSDFSYMGSKSIMFSLYVGQCYKKDCKSDIERAEIKEDKKYSIKNKEFWYRVAFYIPKETELMWPTRYSIWQVKVDVKKGYNRKNCEQGKNLVLLMLNVKQHGISLTRHGDAFCGGHADLIIASHFGQNKEAFGKWIDLTMHVGYYEDPTKGFLKVYINSIPSPAINYKGTMYKKGMIEANVRTGLYNTFVSKTPERGKRELFIDSLGVGNKCKDVQTTNFCIDK